MHIFRSANKLFCFKAIAKVLCLVTTFDFQAGAGETLEFSVPWPFRYILKHSIEINRLHFSFLNLVFVT